MKLVYTLFLILTSICCVAQNRGATVLINHDVPYGTTYAIVIGISKYRNLPPLRYADRDARSFYDYMVSKEGMNVDSSNISLCVNELANINNLGNCVSDILKKDIRKGDRVIFFFAGHGDYDAKIMTDQSLLLLQGAPDGNYFQNVFSGDYISTSDLHIKFTNELIKKGAEVMLIIDACHSGGMNSQLAGGEQGGIITTNALNTIQSTVKMYSCQANQYSLESTQFGGGRGLFSYILMEGLYGMADANNDKAVTMKELQRYLEDNVPVLALPNKQDPIVKTEDNTMVVCLVNDNLLSRYKTTKEQDLPFMLAANIKGSEETWLAAMGNTQKALYQTCKLQLENNNPDKAYTTYKQYELQDNSSEASIMLRRNLSAALQEKTATILAPILEDVSKFNSSLKEIEKAIDDLEKAMELLGTEHFLYKNLEARRLFLKTLEIIAGGNYMPKAKECILYLEQSISLEPNAPYTYILLSMIYYEHGNSTEAEINVKKYLDLIPNSIWALNNYGVMLHDSKHYAEAEKEYKKAIELDPADPDAHVNYGLLLRDLKRFAESESEFNKALTIIPDNAAAHYNYGLLCEDQNRFTEAEREYKKAIELDPSYANAHNNYGVMLSASKRYAEAEREYKKAIELAPSDADAHVNYGLLLSDQKRYEEAESEYKTALELDSFNAAAHNNYAILLENLIRYKDAEIQYRKLIELDPGNPQAHKGLADVLDNLKSGNEAETEYIKAISLDPTNVNAHINYGNLLMQSDRDNEAETEYRIAIELDTDNMIVHNNYGFLLKKLKRYKDAETQYKLVIELDPENTNALYTLSCFYSLQGEKDKAIVYFDKSLQKGMKEPAIWQEDTDLDNIRTLPEFKTLLLKYFKKKELDKYPDLFINKREAIKQIFGK